MPEQLKGGGNNNDTNNPLNEDELKRMYDKNPLLGLTFDVYQKSTEHDYDYFLKIDRWREYIDSILLNNDTESIGGQIIMPQLRKLFKGMENPDGMLQRIAGINKEELLLADAFVRGENNRLEIDTLWDNNREQLKKDGRIFSVFKIDGETGEQFEDFVSGKRLTFNAGADNVHSVGKQNGALMMFEYESVDGMTFQQEFLSKYGEIVKSVLPGNPVAAIHTFDNSLSDIRSNEETMQKENESWFGKTVGMLTTWCTSAPFDMKVKVSDEETIEIKKGQPYTFRVAGGSTQIIMLLVGDDYVWRWSHKVTKQNPKGEPYLPAVPWFDTRFRKGLQVLSFAGASVPYIKRIIRLEDGVDKFINLMADPDFLLNFKRSGAAGEIGSDDNVQTMKNWIALNLKKKLEGKKTTNFMITDTEDGVDIDIKQATPTNLNIASVEARIERIKLDFADVVGVLTNDVSYPADAKVGIIEYKERQQSEQIAGWQELNEPNFVVRNRMLLNHLILFPKRSERKVSITEKGKNQEFVYEKPIQEIREMITPKVLNVPWKFAFSRPTGGVEAIAEQDALDRMIETYQLFGGTPLPSLEKAILNAQAKIVTVAKGTDPFSAEEAFNELQAARGAVEQGTDVEAKTPDQLDAEKLVKGITKQ